MAFKRLRIPMFKGLDTRRGDFGDAASSPDALNFVCADGRMETAGGTKLYAPVLPAGCESMFQAFFRDEQTNAEWRVLMAAGGGSVYALTEEGSWRTIAAGCRSNRWRAVNYRSAHSERLLMVNGVDGMLSWDGVSAQAQTLHPAQGGEDICFEHLTLLYERLWGAVHASAPDRIYWSESFAPEDWEVNYDAPDAGGGFLDVATFDGSRIRAIEAAFDDVLIFKDKSMHRLNGTYPGEFSLTQVYGSEGTIAPRSVVHTADRLYFLGTDGLCIYNGMSVSTLEQSGEPQLRGIWERMNRAALSQACAAIHRGVLYLALPLDGAEHNSHVLEYRINERCASLVALDGVQDWLVVRGEGGEKLLCLVRDCIYEYGAGTLLDGLPVEAHWLSPELTMGTLTAKRTAGRVCMVVDAQACGGQIGLLLTLLGAGRSRSIRIKLREGRNLVRQRIRIRGRTFRFRMENTDGCRLTFPDGMEIVLEEDSDL